MDMLQLRNMERDAWESGNAQLSATVVLAMTAVNMIDAIDSVDVAAGFPTEDCLADLDYELCMLLPEKYHARITELVDAAQKTLAQSAEYGLAEWNKVKELTDCE